MRYRKSNIFRILLNTINQIPPGIALVISLITLIISYNQAQSAAMSNKISADANKLAKEALKESQTANIIAKESKELTKSTSVLEKRQRSIEISDKAYDDIYGKEVYRKEIEYLTQTYRINDTKQFKDIMDIFENLGVKYCNGLVYKSNLSSSFFNTLSYICDNEVIVKNFANQKNSAALLCYELMPGGIYSKTVSQNTLKTCQRVKE